MLASPLLRSARSAYALGYASDCEGEKLTQNTDYVQCDALSGSHIVKGSSPHIIGCCCAIFLLCGSSSARPPTSTLCVGSVGSRRVTDEDASPNGSNHVGISARPRHRSEVTRRSGEKQSFPCVVLRTSHGFSFILIPYRNISRTP